MHAWESHWVERNRHCVPKGSEKKQGRKGQCAGECCGSFVTHRQCRICSYQGHDWICQIGKQTCSRDRSLGLRLTQPDQIPLDPSHAQKSTEQLMSFSQTALSEIAKSYGRPYSGSKPKLRLAIQEGPMETAVLTGMERMLQAAFLPPLKDKERTPHKVGSLNEPRVRNSIGTLLGNFNCEIVDIWECGLISQVENLWLATSLDGWLVYVDRRANSNVEKHAGLEIKTPTGKEWRELIKTHQSHFGTFLRCECGDDEFKLLVYKPDYRMQVMHHATAANLDEVLFVVANKNRPIYSVMISFTAEQRQT
jgi:hypothetical protein